MQDKVVVFIFVPFRNSAIGKMIKSDLSMIGRILYVFQTRLTELSLNILRKFNLVKMPMKT